MRRILVVAVMCIGLSIGTASNTWASSVNPSINGTNLQTWRSFPTQRTDSYSTEYTAALQRILMDYGGTPASKMRSAGGMDGVYGNGTKNAVASLQSDQDINNDGICGRNTWGALYGTLKFTTSNNKKYGRPVYGYSVNNSAPYDIRCSSTNSSWCYRSSGDGSSISGTSFMQFRS